MKNQEKEIKKIWAEKKLRQAGVLEEANEQIIRDEFAEVGPRGGIKRSPKAPKSDTKNPNPKGRGTARGKAGTTRGAKVDKKTEERRSKLIIPSGFGYLISSESLE